MRVTRVAPLIPRIQPQSRSKHPASLQCRRFHPAPSVHLPNRYSKRPAELPKPASKPPRPPPTDPNHGLWQFFRNKRSLTGSIDIAAHGRPWTAEELRRKSWEDLHTLWYKCILERNILATEALEARKQGVWISSRDTYYERNSVVKRTMQQVKFVLWERYRAWWGAHQLNEKDPLLLDRLKEQENAKKLGMSIGQYRQHRVKEDKKAKAAAYKREEEKRERAKQEKIEAQKAAEDERVQKEAELKRKAKEEQEQKDAAMMELHQKLAAGGGPEVAKSEQNPEFIVAEAQSEDVTSQEDKAAETVEQSGNGNENPDNTHKQ